MKSSTHESMKARIAEYFVGKPEVAAVYLFGSFASGKDHKGSDLDVGILFSDTDQDLILHRKTLYLVELSRLQRRDFHLVVMNWASQELLRQIFSKGVCLQINDSGVLTRFRMVQFSRIAEFGYYRKQMQKGLIKKVMGDSTIG